MKKSELVELIREIVREETRNILPEVLVEILKSKKVVTENKRPTKIIDAMHERHERKEDKIYVKNPILNKILNQTKGGIPPEGSLTSLMNSDDFGKVGESTVVPTTDINGRPLNPENIPEHITEALTKNYSKFLKIMDKAAKDKRPV